MATEVVAPALTMNRDLEFSVSAFGLGAGIFFTGYGLCEVPSNLLLTRVGGSRILSWHRLLSQSVASGGTASAGKCAVHGLFLLEGIPSVNSIGNLGGFFGRTSSGC